MKRLPAIIITAVFLCVFGVTGTAIAADDLVPPTMEAIAEAFGNRALACKELGKKKKAIAGFRKFIPLTDDEEYIEIANAQIEEMNK